jgi:hypothetical protein
MKQAEATLVSYNPMMEGIVMNRMFQAMRR